jgi:hypothetical protein
LLSTKLSVELGKENLWASLNSFCNVENSLAKLARIQETNNAKPNNTRSYLDQRQPVLAIKRNHKPLQLSSTTAFAQRASLSSAQRASLASAQRASLTLQELLCPALSCLSGEMV